MEVSSIEAGVSNVLKRFEFHNHEANRWLFLERSRREAILAEAGLLELLAFEADPIHLGNIVCSTQVYDWGQVTFDGVTPDFPSQAKASVYAGFEFLIRQCGLFPSFIRISDLRCCEEHNLDCLPVFGSRILWDRVLPEHVAGHTRKMLELHQILARKDLLIDRPFEVSDAELFERYFRQLAASNTVADEQHLPAPVEASIETDDAPSLDDVNLWHS